MCSRFLNSKHNILSQSTYLSQLTEQLLKYHDHFKELQMPPYILYNPSANETVTEHCLAAAVV